jgi:DnaJ-class molecular chaperone
MGDTFYNTLEVSETATSDEIKKSYRRLSMQYHPDKNPNNPDATAKFQKISEAYETLSDNNKRREYDMTRNNPFLKMMSGNGQQFNQGEQGNPMEDIFSNIFGMHFGQGNPFGQGMPFGPNVGVGVGGHPFGPNVRIFHNGRPVNPQQNFLQKPTPIVKNISIPIDKILTGTTIPVDIERWLIQDGNKVFESETMYVTVPKGIDEGEIIVLKDKGNIVSDECKGDIKIFIKIVNETDFKRSGIDLILEKEITIKEALCGFSFELKYITGKIYTITNNSGNIINNGYRKIIPNMGFCRDQHVGNLIITFNVLFPEKISDESLEQLKKIDF